MNRWIRLWNQNRKECIAGIVIIIAVLITIQLLNAFYAKDSKNAHKQPEIVPINTADEVENVAIEKESTGEVTGGKEISTNTDQQNVAIMKQFIQYCNDKNAEGAYNMLTTESKDLLFGSLENFSNDYIQKYFQTRRSLDYELWKIGGSIYTYKIQLLNDALAEGTLNASNSSTDYFTVLAQDGYWKLNIGGLVKHQSMDKKVEEQGLVWNVTGKEVYMDYEVYSVRVSNRSGKTVMLDALESTKSMWVTGNNGTKFSAISHEIPRADLILRNYGSTTLRIKFNKIYNSITTNALTFSNIILDYDSYMETGTVPEFAQIEIAIN